MTHEEYTDGEMAPWTYWVSAQAAREDTPAVSRSFTERRRRPPPTTTSGYLRHMPAGVILDRLPIPILAVGLDGVLTYANPAFARMLGHGDATALIGRSLPTLLAGRAAIPPRDCVTALRTACRGAIAWSHAESFPIHTVVSEPLLVRASDPVLLISVTDVSEFRWNNLPEPHRSTSHGRC
jgi:PAS domain-containing protein